jgi:hypothetical protein
MSAQMTRRALAWQRIALGAGVLAAAFLLSRGISAVLDGREGRYGDFPCFYWAAVAVVEGTDIHESGWRGYIYPPLLAFLFRPLTWLLRQEAALCWMLMNFAIVMGCTLAAAKEAIRRFGPVSVRQPVLVVAAVALLLTADKTQHTLKQGQTDGLVLLGFVLGLQWLERRPALAGLALGFAANIKYLSILALPYLLFRRRWAAAAWMAFGTIGWGLLPAVSLGWSGNLRALEQAGAGLVEAVGVEVSHGAANVQGIDWNLSLSIPSMVSRLLGPDAALERKGGVTLAIAMAVLGVVWAIFAARGRPFVWPPRPARGDGQGDRVTALEWAGLIVAPLAFGPQTTGRHMVLLLAVHAMAMTVLLGPGSLRRKAPLIVGLVILQMGLVLPPGDAAMFDAARNVWRAIAGPSWCMLAMYLSLLWVGLPDVRGDANPQPAARAGIQPVEP